MAKGQRPESTTKVVTLSQHVEIPRFRSDGGRILNRPTLAKVVQVLAGFSDHSTGSGAHPSLSTVAELVQVSPRTITRAFSTLRGLGVIRLERAHSWRLHRPTTWSIGSKVIQRCLSVYMAKVRERSSKYWARLQALEKRHQSRPGASGRQGVTLPSPLQGERREVGPAGGRGGSILDVLAGLQTI